MMISFKIFLCLLSAVVWTTGLDVCQDSPTSSIDCQSCINSSYPVPQTYRDNCMKTCRVCTDANIAENKPTKQSTTNLYGYSYKAVDGYYNGTEVEDEGATCSSTSFNESGWWCVDLQEFFDISRIVIYSRDKFEENSRGFDVRTSKGGSCDQIGFQSSTSCFKDSTLLPSTQQDGFTVERCNQGASPSLSTQVIFIASSHQLTLCEVEVFTDEVYECTLGYYDKSESTCDACDGCNENNCNNTDGSCILGCKHGLYGNYCNLTCSTGCSENICSQSDGSCIDGCRNGFYGNYCNLTCSSGCSGYVCNMDGWCNCKVGWYGVRCDERCSEACKGHICDKNDGSCICLERRYGNSCRLNCSIGCKNDNCDKTDGSCPCKHGWYGNGCNMTCNEGCLNTTCDKDDGSCNCLLGYYGVTCNQSCSGCFDGVCDQLNGSCSTCKAGWKGIFCSELVSIQDRIESDDEWNRTTLPVAVVIGAAVGVGAAVLFAVVLFTMIIVLHRRRRRYRKYSKASTDGETLTRLNLKSVDDSSSSISDPNTPEMTTRVNVATENSPTRIKLTDLMKLTREKKIGDVFPKEYELLPSGLCAGHTYSMNDVNKLKNRYKNICAFDHSRVKLDVINNDLNSDYINACYITGYGDAKGKYIASQGPTEDTIHEFWRMVWVVRTEKIVMVTNVMETGVQKCFQYWPNKGEVVKFGQIMVKLVDKDVFANYIIRTLEVTRDNCDPRIIHQYHFTSWPDKGLPTDITALLDFRHQVHKNNTHLSRPIIVHCSAGIGRTGTFITLDYLIDEGRDDGQVDVFQCLRRMRYERVDVVQTLNQYIFIHDALIQWYITGDVIDPVTSFNMELRKLLKPKRSGKTDLQEKFEMMKEAGLPIDPENFTVALSEENKTKNRDSLVLPANSYRVYLKSCGSRDYINAVFLPTLRRKKGFILTQTPLISTVDDFWQMVVDWKVSTIINMDGTDSFEDVGEYLPDGDEMETTSCILTKQATIRHENGFYTTTTYSLQHKQRDELKEEVRVYQFHFWDEKRKLPRSVDSVLSLVEELDRWKDDNHSPIVVHCVNGVETSSIICVLLAIFTRINCEQEVAVLQTILQHRVARQQIITTFDQLKFCFDAVDVFIDRNSTCADSCL